MKQHVNKCKKYREVYKIKLSSKKVSDLIKDQIKMYERDLDEVNIRIQRQVSNTSTFMRAFLYPSVLRGFSLVTVVIFWRKNYGTKAALSMFNEQSLRQ